MIATCSPTQLPLCSFPRQPFIGFSSQLSLSVRLLSLILFVLHPSKQAARQRQSCKNGKRPSLCFPVIINIHGKSLQNVKLRERGDLGPPTSPSASRGAGRRDGYCAGLVPAPTPGRPARHSPKSPAVVFDHAILHNL